MSSFVYSWLKEEMHCDHKKLENWDAGTWARYLDILIGLGDPVSEVWDAIHLTSAGVYIRMRGIASYTLLTALPWPVTATALIATVWTMSYFNCWDWDSGDTLYHHIRFWRWLLPSLSGLSLKDRFSHWWEFMAQQHEGQHGKQVVGLAHWILRGCIQLDWLGSSSTV